MKIIIRHFSKCLFLLLLCLQINSFAVARATVAHTGPKPENVMIAAEDIDRALKNHSAEILAIPGVESAARGICGGNPCLKIYVSQESPDLRERLEAILCGLPFEIEISGSFQAL